MDQQQVDIVQPQPFQTRFAGVFGALKTVPLAVELGGHEHLVTRYRRVANTLTHTALIVIVLGGVDQAVAQFQSGCDGCGGFGIVHRPGAQPKLGHFNAVGQRQGRGGVYTHQQLSSVVSVVQGYF